MIIRYSTPQTTFKLPHIYILENSEVVFLNGQRLAKGTEYEIYYDIGQIRFKTEEAARPDAEISVELTATCVLSRPNPYDPSKGPLTFFGSGIVPGNTKIKIYTLSGDVVAHLWADVADKSATTDIQWNGKNKKGKPVSSGIYIYVYESSKEQGVGKITIISK